MQLIYALCSDKALGLRDCFENIIFKFDVYNIATLRSLHRA